MASYRWKPWAELAARARNEQWQRLVRAWATHMVEVHRGLPAPALWLRCRIRMRLRAVLSPILAIRFALRFICRVRDRWCIHLDPPKGRYRRHVALRRHNGAQGLLSFVLANGRWPCAKISTLILGNGQARVVPVCPSRGAPLCHSARCTSVAVDCANQRCAGGSLGRNRAGPTR